MRQDPIRSSVEDHHGVPTLFVDGTPVSALAYISYLDECARYEDFAKAGYRIYSFPAYFGGRGINVHSGLKEFRKGIFDHKDEPDFAVFDQDVGRILDACPEALIFPRICMMMPVWWEEENPGERNQLSDSSYCRESFSSMKWRQDATEMLSLLIGHIEQSAYRDHIVAYHIAEGGTEEWVHFGNPISGFGERAGQGFLDYMRVHYPEEAREVTGLPTYDSYGSGSEFISIEADKSLIRFLEYTNWIIADTICYFAAFVKGRTGRRLAVGAFYGYTLELTDARNGHHDLKQVLECPDVDFLCSPNSYMNGRGGGFDWPHMSVLDSVKLHGKLWLSECDTRTYLTRPLKEARPWICREGTYIDGVWIGPSSPEVSLWFIRKNFARNLVTGIGQWWFDMWGGWFADQPMMDEMAEYRSIADRSLQDDSRGSIAEVAVIVDESAYRYLNPQTMLAHYWNYMHRYPIGLAGAPYDIYDVSDMEQLPQRYRLIIFAGLFPDNTCSGDRMDGFIKHRTSLGNTVLFTYLPFGIKDGRFDFGNTAEVLGFPLKQTPAAQEMIYKNGERSGWSYTPEHFCSIVAGQGMEVLAAYDDGSCAAALRPSGNGYLAYSALPELSIPLLRSLYAHSGVHVFCEKEDVVYAGNHYIAIHAAVEGVKTLHLPQIRQISELFSGKKSFIGDKIEVSMKKFETLVFRLDG